MNLNPSTVNGGKEMVVEDNNTKEKLIVIQTKENNKV